MARIATAGVLLAGMLAAPVAAQIPVPEDGRVRLNNVGAGVTYNFTGDNYGAVYIGHYGFSFVSGPTGTYAGLPGLSGNFDAWCVDFDTNVSLGQTWYVNLTRLSESNLSATRLMQPVPTGEAANYDGAFDRYQRAAWLTTQFALYANHAQRASVWGAIHAAIWNITGANNPQPNTVNTNPTSIYSRAYWLTQAGQANTASLNMNEYIVMTATPNAGVAQEFLVRAPTVVPEPATLLLMGSGLAGIGIAGMRRRRKNNKAESEDQLA